MRALAFVHKFPPVHCAGAEMMLHAILKWLAARGHQVEVVWPGGPTLVWDGVPITDTSDLHDRARAADVLLTHLDVTGDAMRLAADVGRPLVHLVHNDQQLAYHRVRDAALVVMNSRWLARAYQWPGPQIIVRPPVFADDYRTDTPTRDRRYVTLLNLTADKGGPLFFRLAENEPARQFLAVKGAYGVQAIPQRIPANVTVVENTALIRDIYAETRVLLVPSAYESWGRVAIEAGASGIPVVAHPTAGLVESLDGAGIFRHRDRPAQWTETLAWLDDPENYALASETIRERVDALDPTDELIALEHALQLVAEGRSPEIEATYARDVVISSRCPICGVPGHACGPKTDVTGSPLVLDAPRNDPGPKRVYSIETDHETGAYQFSLSHAQRRGLAPDGNELHAQVVGRLHQMQISGPQLASLRVRYAQWNADDKQAFLDQLWSTRTQPGIEWVATFPAAAVAPSVDSPTQVEGDEVPQGRVGLILSWVDGDPDRARRALEIEQQRGEPRVTLISALEEIVR